MGEIGYEGRLAIFPGRQEPCLLDQVIDLRVVDSLFRVPSDPIEVGGVSGNECSKDETAGLYDAGSLSQRPLSIRFIKQVVERPHQQHYIELPVCEA